MGMVHLLSQCVCICLFFFKQKTAYKMRISDGSSDVCSSDLIPRPAQRPLGRLSCRIEERGSVDQPSVLGGLCLEQHRITEGLLPPVQEALVSVFGGEGDGAGSRENL